MNRWKYPLAPTMGFALALTCALLPGSSYAQGTTPATPEAQLATEIRAKMDSVGLVGLAAAVIVDRKVVWTSGFGHSDWKRTTPFTPDTAMNVASVAKPFVGVAMMQAVAAGKLNLDEDINRYLPFKVVNPHRPGEKITLRHLATHTSSITDRWEAYRKSYDFDGDPKQSLADYLRDYFVVGGAEYSKDNFLDAKLGEERDYSNIGAALAGYIVEQVMGEPLNVLTKRTILDPLQMSRTGWFLREMNPQHLSTLFVAHNGHILPIRPYGPVTYPDGGLRASVSDLTKFFLMMLNDGVLNGTRVLAEAQAKEMQRFQFAAGNRPKNYPEDQGNSGLFWRTKFGGARVGHGGNDPGVAVEMLASLDKSVAVVVMSNTSTSGPDSAAFGDILNLLWKYGEAKRAGRASGTRN